jgi:predicted phage terminase large subunit-like protein
MQRLSTNDLAQYVMDAETEDWDIVTVKAYDEENKKSFWEEKFPIKKLEELKVRTPELYYSQYQQEPRATGGGLFTRDMFQVDALPEFFEFTAIVADTAYRGTERNDWTVFMAIGRSNNRLYVLDIKKMRVNSDKIEEYFMPFIEKYCHREDFIGCYIEPKGHGIYLNQHLPQLGVPIQADTIIRDFYKDRKRDKVIRANVVLPDIANFKVTFSTEVPKDLVQETISQCLGFPEDRHDDIVDCIVDSAKLVYKHIPSLLEVL